MRKLDLQNFFRIHFKYVLAENPLFQEIIGNKEKFWRIKNELVRKDDIKKQDAVFKKYTYCE